ncbi:MAG: GAF domain-containing protein [Chloroflexi bacterium]|nr:GAF domain-containing protein [Chloroflexota bacterium]
MKQSKHHSLDRMLLRLLFLRLFLPSLIVTILAIGLVAHARARNLETQQQLLARSLAHTVDDYLEYACQILDTVAQVAETTTVEELASYMRATQQAYPYFVTIYQLDKDGSATILVPHDAHYQGLDMSHQPYHIQSSAQTDVTISQPFISSRTGLPSIYMAKSLGNNEGIVVGELDLGELQKSITTKGDEQYFIADRSGVLLAHSELDQVTQQVNVSHMKIVQQGLVGEATLPYITNNTFVLGSASLVEQTEWVVVVQISIPIAYAPYIWALVVALVFAPLVWLTMILSFQRQLGYRVVAPLAQLRQGADALASGDFTQGETLSNIPATFSEVNTLAADFERMGQAIQTRQAALQKSEARFREMAEMLPDMIFETDTELNVTYANRAALKTSGYTEKEWAEGIQVTQMLASEEIKRVQRDLTAVIQGESRKPGIYRIKRKNGDIFPCEVTLDLIHNETGNLIGFRGVARDITDRKKAEDALRQSEEKYRTILENIKMGYYQVDIAGNLEFFNDAMCRILGYSKDELLGMNNRQFMSTGTAKKVYQAFNTVYRTGESVQAFDWELVRKDKTPIFVNTSVSLIRDSTGDPIGFRGVAHDITEQKRAEKEIRQRTAQLEALRQVGLELTAQLDTDALLRSIVARAVELLGGTSGGLDLYRPNQDVLEFAVYIGIDSVPHKTTLQRGEGLAGKVWETGEPLIINNYQEWEGRVDFWNEHYPNSVVVGVPVHWGNEFLGVLEIIASQPRTFSPTDAELLSLFATQAAIAIRNARLFDESHRRAEELAVLNELAQALTARTDVDTVLEEAYRGVSRLMDTTNFFIGLYSQERDKISIQYDVSESGQDAHILTVPANKGLIGYIVRNRASLLIPENTPERLQEIGVEPIGEPFQSWLGVPLPIGDRVLGVMAVQSYTTPHAYNEHDRDLLTAIASQTAVSLENAQLYEQAQQEIVAHKWAEEKAYDRAGHLSALNAVIAAAAATTNLSDLLKITLSHILTALRLETGGIWLAGQHTTRGLSLETNQFSTQTSAVGWEDIPDIRVIEDWRQVTDSMLSPLRPLAAQLDIRSSITMPILIGVGDVGRLLLTSAAPRSWSVEEVALVEAVGRQLGTVAERLRLFQAEREQRELAEALEKAAAAVSSTLDPDEVMDRILEQVEQVVPGDAFNIMLMENHVAHTARWRGYDRLGEQVSENPISIAQYPTLIKMIETGEPVIIADTSSETDWISRKDLHWLHSYIGAPIRLGNETVGFLNVNGTQPNQFGPTDARRLQALTSHAATAIENARLFGQTQQRVAELQVLQRTSLQLTSSLALPAVLESIVESALTLVKANNCHIYLYNEETKTFTFGTALWKDGRQEAAVQSLRTDGLMATVTREGQPVVINDAQNHPLYATPEAQKWQVRAIAGFPLKRANQILGTFAITFLQPHTFSPEEVRVLGLLTNQAAIAIENVQLYQQLHDHAAQLEERVEERTVQIQAQYARQEAILRSASDGIIVTDAGGEIIQSNLIANTWLTQTLSPEDAGQLRKAVQNLVQQATAPIEEMQEERPETILELTGLDLELKSAPISEPGIEDAAAVVVAVHDVSHLKALNRMKSRFVTNVSHELRTPITTIKLYAALMQKIPRGDERWKQYLNTLAQEADRQALLVQDILQISRIDAGRIEMSPREISINDLTDRAFANGQVMARQQGVALEHHPANPGPIALVDPERMMQVLTNLIDNAIRYTPESGDVAISTGTAESKGRVWATVTVADTGMGIPEEEVPHVFDRFFRGVEPRSMQISGTGLGLALVKEIVELHGGWVTVESEANVGTSFAVWLPSINQNTSPQ